MMRVRLSPLILALALGPGCRGAGQPLLGDELRLVPSPSAWFPWHPASWSRSIGQPPGPHPHRGPRYLPQRLGLWRKRFYDLVRLADSTEINSS
jgi:hypothetical protein